MPDPTGGNDNIPPWILPYVHLHDHGAASIVASAALFRHIAGRIQDTKLRDQVQAAASEFLDEFCGTVPRMPPRPRGWGYLDAAQTLASLAEHHPATSFARDLQAAAGNMARRGADAMSMQ